MSLSAAEVWERLLLRARAELPESTYRTWLEPTEALALDGDTIVIGAPDQFAADWNESKHAALLASFGPVALGHPVAVTFKVHEDRKKRAQMDFLVEPPPAPARDSGLGTRDSGAGRVASPESRVPTQQRVVSAPLNPRYTFDHFVIGKSNDVAAAAALGAAQAPGKVYNPLFIYGDTGLGKTHLIQAVAHALLERNPHTRVTYVNTEQFTNEFVAAIQGRTTLDFRRRYRETDLLLVDDVQFLRGKETTQEEFFHTFNAIYEAGRQICLTSDRPPKEIPGLEGRLVSRFEWGMVTNVDLPEFEHRVAILRKKAELDHLESSIPDEVIEFIAEHVTSSVRELEGSIIKLLAFASLKHKDITIELAREALRDKIRSEDAIGIGTRDSGLGTRGGLGSRVYTASPTTKFAQHAALSVMTIQQMVAAEWGVTPEGLQSKTRTKTLTTPRQVAMLLCRELLGLQLVEIGNAFGGRDHSTVIHSLERAAEMIGEDERFRARVEKVRGMLETLRT
ncbi:Chromosomal replication initiator protein dnaA [Gemmatirosa kalamazoonensis]|uniref:Chromosomal replication initiator protein DnaA n=1 Tax=Gemmatirosa kalamazoonensis TaxID=861299 RepID=W0RGT3_9BACT|nr:chromosomal replication initiator protein DnaA [Gemmatirosa kalamazoonensis]AHG88608.1 Chromosomal replication initiator protein dnaA [Gemmatirosa kalamazoonensis]